MASLIDASSIIHGWENYPFRQFPGLWKWIATKIEEKTIYMLKENFLEVENKAPDCVAWLAGNNLHIKKLSSTVIEIAKEIQNDLGIEDLRLNIKGVNENDIYLIASAKYEEVDVITNESLTNPTPSS